jgi:hypothetical protein
MPAKPLQRGAVVRCNSRIWIIWADPAGVRAGDPIALPLVPQTGPLHRSQARLDFDGRAVLVHLLDPVSLPRRDCEPIAQCAPEIVVMLAAAMQRAIAANAFEHRFVERRIA